MEMTQTTVWLILVIMFLVIEIATVGLTCIWFAGGSLAGMILSMLDVHIGWQIVGAIIVTAVLLIFTRPFLIKYVTSKQAKTNYEQLIGQTICIRETVDNLAQTGSALVNGQEWTVRATKEVTLQAGTLAKIIEISGVKLMVEPCKEDV